MEQERCTNPILARCDICCQVTPPSVTCVALQSSIQPQPQPLHYTTLTTNNYVSIISTNRLVKRNNSLRSYSPLSILQHQSLQLYLELNPSETDLTLDLTMDSELQNTASPQFQRTYSSSSSRLGSRRTSQQLTAGTIPNILPSNTGAVLGSPQASSTMMPVHVNTDNSGVGPGPGPMRHPRPRTQAEMYLEMEKEQEAVVRIPLSLQTGKN